MQVYRSLNHREMLEACKLAREQGLGFPKAIVDYAAFFLRMYKSRCDADYDPTEAGDFRVPQALNYIGEVEEVIRRFDGADEDDRRAFAILVAVKRARKQPYSNTSFASLILDAR